jgi:holo-[acyl-carrier protein] synthase
MEVGIDFTLESSLSKIVKNRKYMDFLFTEREISSADRLAPGKQGEYYASRFCAKEAAAKALGTGFISKDNIKWKDIEIIGEKGSNPRIELHNNGKSRLKKMGYKNIKLSFSHKDNYVVAIVMVY